jgi:hypothetical protein
MSARSLILVSLALAACNAAPSDTAITPANHERFPIDVGSMHEGVDCSACHGEFDSFKQFDCHSSGCHAETDIAPAHASAKGYEFVSQSCYLCHPRGIVGVGVDHTLSFPIDQGDTHQNTSCSICHAQSGDPKNVTCATGSCHGQAETDATHPDSLGYVWGPSTCLACHPNSRVGSVDHTVLFPISNGDTHGTVACVTCHQDSTDFSQVTCMTGNCHGKDATDTWHADVNGYEYVASSCLGCHPQGQTNLVDHNRFFPIGDGQAHGTQCSDCHKSADRHQVTCAGGSCHGRDDTDNLHSAVLGYEYLSSSCLACHPNARTGQQDHGRFFPIQGGTPHGQVACESCHRDPVSRTPVTCVGADCHPQAATDPIHVGFADYAYASGACLNCHLGGQKQLDHSAFPTTTGTPHAGIACAQCHTNPGDRHVLGCANAPCHDPALTAPKHAAVGGYQWESTMCMFCHGDGTVAKVADHLPFDIAPGAPHSGKPCLQCHPATQIGRPAVTDFKIRNCFSAGCHITAAVNALHAVVAAGSNYKPDSVSCLQAGCHQNGHKP